MIFITLDELEAYYTTSKSFLAVLEIELLMHGHRACYPKAYSRFRDDLFYMRFILNEQQEIIGFVTFAIGLTYTGPNIIILQREILLDYSISMKEVNNEVEYMVNEFCIPIMVLPNSTRIGDTEGFSANVKIIDINKI